MNEWPFENDFQFHGQKANAYLGTNLNFLICCQKAIGRLETILKNSHFEVKERMVV